VTTGIAVDDTMLLYSKGIFASDSCNSKKINHAVTIVGYGSDGGDEYMIIRNQWGASWGEKGYMRLKLQQNDGKDKTMITKFADGGHCRARGDHSWVGSFKYLTESNIQADVEKQMKFDAAMKKKKEEEKVKKDLKILHDAEKKEKKEKKKKMEKITKMINDSLMVYGSAGVAASVGGISGIFKGGKPIGATFKPKPPMKINSSNQKPSSQKPFGSNSFEGKPSGSNSFESKRPGTNSFEGKTPST